MKSNPINSILVAGLLGLSAGNILAQTTAPVFTPISVLKQAVDGANPYGELTLSGSTLYGTTHIGVSSKGGTIYSMTTNGQNISVVHSFNTATEGGNPTAGVAISGDTVYGTTLAGGTGGYGTVYSVKVNGTAFTVLHSFTGSNDGGEPYAGVIVDGDTLYGTTELGGKSEGVVYSMKTNGADFTILHAFNSSLKEGSTPKAGVVLSGSTLYGVTTGGGTKASGTIYSIKTNGTSFTTLYSFTGGNDGMSPSGGLIVSGNRLYGTTSLGGRTSGFGAVFSIGVNGVGFSTIYSFDSTTGGSPKTDLILSPDGTLFGTASIGPGFKNNGEIYSVDTNGGGFSILHTFTNGVDGANPLGGLVLSGKTLYGVSNIGGGSLGNGVVYKVTLPGPQSQVITFPSIASTTFGVKPFTITGTASSGLKVNFTVESGPATLIGSTVSVTGAGTVTIQADQLGNVDFYAAPSVRQTFIASKASNSIVFVQPSVRSYVPGGTFSLAATAKASPVNFASGNSNIVSITGSTVTMRGAGLVNITASQVGNGNYQAAVPVTRSLTINKAAQVVVFTPPPSVPLATTSTIGLTASAPGGEVSFTSSNTNVISVTGSTATIHAKGSASITATQDGTTDYSPASATKVITVK